MTGEANVTLELDDIQSGVLRPRPTPYAATYILFRLVGAPGGDGFVVGEFTISNALTPRDLSALDGAVWR